MSAKNAPERIYVWKHKTVLIPPQTPLEESSSLGDWSSNRRHEGDIEYLSPEAVEKKLRGARDKALEEAAIHCLTQIIDDSYCKPHCHAADMDAIRLLKQGEKP